MISYTLADLKEVDWHIARGEQHILRQEEIVASLRAHSAEVVEAERLLGLFHELQQEHYAHRDVIAAALARG
jgi:hypothetical protein